MVDSSVMSPWVSHAASGARASPGSPERQVRRLRQNYFHSNRFFEIRRFLHEGHFDRHDSHEDCQHGIHIAGRYRVHIATVPVIGQVLTKGSDWLGSSSDSTVSALPVREGELSNTLQGPSLRWHQCRIITPLTQTRMVSQALYRVHQGLLMSFEVYNPRWPAGVVRALQRAPHSLTTLFAM